MPGRGGDAVGKNGARRHTGHHGVGAAGDCLGGSGKTVAFRMTKRQQTQIATASTGHCVAIALIVIVGLLGPAQSAAGQGVADRGAFVALIGNDTIVVDRFVRTVDTLRGSVSLKGQPRVEYVVALEAGETPSARFCLP